MRKFLRILCFTIAVLIALFSMSVSAAQIFKDGTSVTFHNASKNYIVDDIWIEGKFSAELRNNTLYVSMEDFKAAFKCPLSYSYEDTSISLNLDDRLIKQTLGEKVLYVNDAPYPVAAPYISPQEGHPVMIALEPFASTMGYTGIFETTEVYPPGQMNLSIEKVPYTLTRVEVNQAAQLVTVYGKSPSGNIEPVKHMLCSTGVGGRTPNGTYRISPLGTNWYYFPAFNCYVRYCSQITGNICFHSLTFNGMGNGALSRSAYNAIGTKASHGCIRLFVDDAAFIHQNCRYLPVTISSGYTNSETDAIRTQILSSKPSYEEYVKSLH